MTSIQLKKFIQQGENIQVEFKTCRDKLNKDTFETICAFLNRSGGHLFLGVSDKKEIIGVDEVAIPLILNTIAINANNFQKLNPPYYFSPEIIEIQNKKVIAIYIPESSQVHSTAGKIFDRNEDGDFNITTNADLVTQLYLRKQKTYSENQVFPFATIDDFKPELFDKVRTLVRNQKPNHPWLNVNNEELLKSAGLYKKDIQTGKSGYTLASLLLLGKDHVLLSVLPHFKTDAILRKVNIDRYDDRDDIRVNLIESYERLMNFVSKHLPDKFYLEGNQRLNIRDNIFREVIGNLLIHREFANAYPAKLIIEKTRVVTENWNKPHGNGNIDPSNFTPYPKNPMIARFFKEIGWVDELGSGLRKVFKYTSLYTLNAKPEFIEEDVFKTIIPTAKTTQKTYPETTQKNYPENYPETVEKIIEILLQNPKITRIEIAKTLGEISENGVKYQLNKLKKSGKIIRIGSDRLGFWKVNKE